MFPWEKLNSSKVIRALLEEMAEWSDVHLELITEEKLSMIQEFVERYQMELHLITNQKGKVVGAFPGKIDETLLVEWSELIPTNGKSLAGYRWLTFGEGIDISTLQLNEKYIFARYGFNLWLKVDFQVDEGMILYPEVEHGRLSRNFVLDGSYSLYSLTRLDSKERIEEILRELREEDTHLTEKRVEKALLVGLDIPKNRKKDQYSIEESLEELEQLTQTAGAEVVNRITQSRDTAHSAYYIGPGKTMELKYQAYLERIDLIIFDDELTPAQQRNLEEMILIKVVDRSRLILDIFAQHARTREGKLQVELAQLKYMLPRLMGLGQQLSRLGAGIGTRGPGETKLEVDRRRIRKRIGELQEEIKQVAELRELHHQGRTLPIVALVGYTNAGKSTTLNRLTNSDVLVENKLFATLDPTMRKLDLGSSAILLSDTVGFIQKLPHQLVAAFRATLEEVQRAEIILHVVDASHPGYEKQIRTVLDVLGDLEVLEKPIITVYNKGDLLSENEIVYLNERNNPSVVISSLTGMGVEKLFDLIRTEIEEEFAELEIVIPYNQGGWVEKLHQVGNVLVEEYQNEGIYLKVKVNPTIAGQLKEYMIH